MTEREPTAGSPASAALSALEALFHEAMQQQSGQRIAWVDAQCAADPGQAALLKRMLAHAEAEATGLGEAIGGFARESAAPRDRSGESIGRYRLLSRIRYGGMAEVYRAARADGEFEQRVALKVVRSDRVSPQLNALFAAERALLARLSHPHIIQIFDGGTTGSGEAWFVMELLDGLPLLAAISASKLDGNALLGHLIDLCGALAHVHGQLIVHRDLKPENVLLCRTPQGLCIKLIDFGIAARLQTGLDPDAQAEARTEGGSWHSPGYAAPEAREGLPHGAAADVYSLGRLLLDCVALVPARLREELRAIGEHASQTDPAQRYASATRVADELLRLRRGEPISLFRQRRGYVLRRALQRHRWAVATALFLLAAGTAWLARESQLRLAAEQATLSAEAERDRARAMRDFLLKAFDSGNPSLNRGEEPRVSELVVGQLDLLQGASDLDPDSHYELLGSFADLLLHLDRRELAERAYVQASELAAAQDGPGGLRWIAMTTRRGQLASRDGRFEDAANLFAEARAALDRLPPSLESARAASVLYSSWGASAQRNGRLDEAEGLIRRGLEAKAILQAAGDPAGDEAAMRVTLGAVQSARGDFTGALDTFETAYRDHLGAGHSQTFEHLALLGWLGISLDRLGRGAESEPYLREAVSLAEKLFAQPNSRLSGSYANLGRMLLNQGRLAEAEPLLRRALDVSEAAGEGDTPNHALRLGHLGLLAAVAERQDEALTLLGEALARSEGTLGAAHRRTQAARLALLSARADTTRDVPRLAEVETLLANIGEAPFRTEALLLAARLGAEQGATARAKALLDEALAQMEAGPSATLESSQRRWLQARALLALAQHEGARDAFLQAADSYQAAGLDQHPGRGRALLQAALLHPPGSPEREDLGQQASTVLRGQLQPPAASLALLELL